MEIQHTRCILAATVVFMVVVAAAAQDSQDVDAGRTIFRAACVRCHGVDARGFTGPDLTAAAARADAESRLPPIIKSGISGTDMPAAALLSDADVTRVVAYLRSLGAPTKPVAPLTLAGDASHGEQIFWGTAGCGSCHYVNGRGGRIGPNLSRGVSVLTTAARDALRVSIRRPSETITPGYVPISIVLRDGRRIRGIRKNEDAFSVQVLDSSGQLRGYLKDEVREVAVDRESLMPPYGPDRLSDADLDDVIRYLLNLREAAAARAAVRTP
jgi:putative heme-binding domain-containing protein